MKKLGYLVLVMNCFAVSSVFADENGNPAEVVVVEDGSGSGDVPQLFGCGCGQKTNPPRK